MPLTVLSVAYPFAAVSPDSCGGAEQILATLDAALAASGHRSIVVAASGSRVSGTLVPVATAPVREIDDAHRVAIHARVREAIAHALAAHRVDLVHLHGIDFAAYLPAPGVPVLATLHLPPDWYSAEALAPARPRTYLHCVSETQHAACPPGVRLLPPIPNGIDVAAFENARHARRPFLLALGRVCPEKGQHIALDVAHRTGSALLLGGAVFPYAAHRAYFEMRVRPALDRRRRFLGPVGFVRKRRLLAAARAVLIPSLAAETSSLVAMEAAACGTPVIAFGRGALAETVENGISGRIVADADAMAAAVAGIDAIDPAACRSVAARRFRREDMAARYLALYRDLAAS